MSMDHADWPARLIDAGLQRLAPLRRHPPAFDVHRLLLAARRQARLDDFGEPSFRQALDRLVAALDDEAQLTPLGRRSWRQNLVTLLASRLAVRDRTKRSTNAAEPGRLSPIVVVGPNARRVGGVAGDDELLAVSFASLRFARSAAVPGYDDWLLGADLGAAYELHRLQLELRGDGRAQRRPVLTADDHLWNLDCVHRIYPDSTLVVVDGGVPDTSAAVVDELAAQWARSSDRVDRRRVEQWWTRRAEAGAARVARHRELWPTDRVVDVESADVEETGSAPLLF